MAKRLVDLLVALVGIVLFWPIGLAVWLGIKTDDGGPLFFRQMRVGRHGRPFQILKFRTMRAGADRAGPSITATGDPRVTRIGRWLRRTKLDELPQLWNVLRGEMSLVGPRPEVPEYVAHYTEAQRAVLALRPGLTDEATLAFRDEERLLAAAPDPERYYLDYCLPRKIELNLAYARRASVLSDLLLVGRTIAAVWLKH